MLAAMVQAGKANVLAFNMALKACEKAGAAQRALLLLGEMEAAGCVVVCLCVAFVRPSLLTPNQGPVPWLTTTHTYTPQ